MTLALDVTCSLRPLFFLSRVVTVGVAPFVDRLGVVWWCLSSIIPCPLDLASGRRQAVTRCVSVCGAPLR